MLILSRIRSAPTHLYISRFGQESVEKMVKWCMEHVPASESPSILEVGTGNGVLLTSLIDNGYDPKLIQGIDYSLDAIRLAKKVALVRGGLCSQITYSVCDFLSEDIPKLDQKHPSFDLILDKGTFDAIALAQKNSDDSIPSHIYPTRLVSALSNGGYFLITCICSLSCRHNNTLISIPFSMQLHGGRAN